MSQEFVCAAASSDKKERKKEKREREAAEEEEERERERALRERARATEREQKAMKMRVMSGGRSSLRAGATTTRATCSQATRLVTTCKESRIGKKPVPVGKSEVKLQGQILTVKVRKQKSDLLAHARTHARTHASKQASLSSAQTEKTFCSLVFLTIFFFIFLLSSCGKKGPLGTLTREFPSEIALSMTEDNSAIKFTKREETRKSKQLHGLCRSLGQNMVTGVIDGWKKNLSLIGVGYRASMKGSKQLELSLGFIHPVILDLPEGVKVTVDKSQTAIEITGYDKEVVGNFAAIVRSKRPPEVYKGKGIRYVDEYVRMKEGKAGKK